MKKISMLDLINEYQYMKSEIDLSIQKCLSHQKWIFGPEIREFEDTIAKYIGVKHCIGTSSGTEALLLSLRSLAIKLYGNDYFEKKYEIITTPFSFTATGDVILRSGATPVFIDIDPATYNISTEKIKDYLTLEKNNAIGIIPVHLYGQPCNMDEIMNVAEEYNLFVIEDAAQAFGSIWRGNKIGSIGNAGAFSFFPSKNLGAFGDAGMIATNDIEINELSRMLLKHGGKDKYNVDYIGYNARIDTLQAAILLAKFKYIDEFNIKRRTIAEIYTKELSGIKGLSLPVSYEYFRNSNHFHVFHQYTIRTPKRNMLKSYLENKGISTMVYYPYPLHKMRVFKGRSKVYGAMINAEKASEEVLSLPIEPLQSEEDTMYVVNCVREFFDSRSSN